jgi:hypothetical protein
MSDRLPVSKCYKYRLVSQVYNFEILQVYNVIILQVTVFLENNKLNEKYTSYKRLSKSKLKFISKKKIVTQFQLDKNPKIQLA